MRAHIAKWRQVWQVDVLHWMFTYISVFMQFSVFFGNCTFQICISSIRWRLCKYLADQLSLQPLDKNRIVVQNNRLHSRLHTSDSDNYLCIYFLYAFFYYI